MVVAYSQKWNLNSLFQEGYRLDDFSNQLVRLGKSLDQLETSANSASFDLPLFITQLQEFEMQLEEFSSFVACLLAQDTSDQKAIEWNESLSFFGARMETLSVRLSIQLLSLSDLEFQQLLENDQLKSIAFALQERRNWGREKLSLAQENLINQLAIDGYQGWSELYTTKIGQIRIPFEDKDKIQELSVGQAENKLSHPDRQTRKSLFEQWEKTWTSQEAVFAQLLNHLGGFRLKVYQQRGWHNVLKEPLFYNRMQEKTLQAMWKAIEQNKEPVVNYIKKKAEFLDLPHLAWYDLEAPVGADNQALISYEDAANMIIEQFGSLSTSMGRFASHAFENSWIECEDRKGKRPGGFCSKHPKSQQSRIFMTYSGTQTNVFTLAHELGHAYHNEVVKDLPMMAQQYRMNVAETASIMAETILVDALLKKTTSQQEKRKLLDCKLQRSVIFLMNIHARFLFETRFYQERQKGLVVASRLNELMEESQKEAYKNSLSEWHPHFWVAKGHFYITDVPFYNFPYTFGYLFSLGIYAQSQKDPEQFASRYENLLRDTGQMTVESLAQKHLGVDLTQPDFWQNALDLIKKDVEEFM